MLPFLGIGTIRAVFQQFGNDPVRIDIFNNLVSVGVVISAVALSILAETLSVPDTEGVDKETSKGTRTLDSNKNKTTRSV